MVVRIRTDDQLQIKALAKVQTRFAIATLVLTEGAVPSRLPTLRACDAVASRRRSRSCDQHREKARTDAILWCSIVCATRRVWYAGKKWIGRLAEREIFGLFPVGTSRSRVIYIYISKLAVWSGWTCVRASRACTWWGWMDSAIRGTAYLACGLWKFRPLTGHASYWDRITRTLWSLSLAQLLKQSYTATAPKNTSRSTPPFFYGIIAVHLHHCGNDTSELNVLPAYLIAGWWRDADLTLIPHDE